MPKLKIGIPRAVYYYDYYPFWAGFFYHLGISLAVSPKTNRRIMEQGLKNAPDDTCLPIKILVGHLYSFSNVDAVFLPRMVSMEQKTYLCPKYLGLPESVIPNPHLFPPILTVNVNARDGKRKVESELERFAQRLGFTAKQGRRAWKAAEQLQQVYWQLRNRGWGFEEAIQTIERIAQNSTCEESLADSSLKTSIAQDKPTIALVGHPYLIYENYANLNLLPKLQAKVNLKMIENLEIDHIQSALQKLRKTMFWGHGKRILGAGMYYTRDETIDGIIYLTCFGCGTDSITQDIVAREARQAHKPYMTITLDEHSGEAGLITRLEAYIDMIERRKTGEDNLSAHG